MRSTPLPPTLCAAAVTYSCCNRNSPATVSGGMWVFQPDEKLCVACVWGRAFIIFACIFPNACGGMRILMLSSRAWQCDARLISCLFEATFIFLASNRLYYYCLFLVGPSFLTYRFMQVCTPARLSMSRSQRSAGVAAHVGGHAPVE